MILLLDLVRTFSHFDSNMITMARHQVGATVLGCMSVYCDVVEVQSFGLDTLAKIAKFKPAIDKKVSRALDKREYLIIFRDNFC